jgi:4-amino-4-deoxy-L-arabinose transferase-like glycosyltransferase
MKNKNTILYLLAIVKFVLPFFLQHPVYEPHRDEFLYLAEGAHPAWGYMEIPPLLSVFAILTNWLGGSMFWLKFWPSLFGALTYLLAGKIILSLGGRWLALVLAFLPFIFGAYLRVHFLFQPNFLEIFFWSLIAFALIRYVQTQRNGWLYLAGIAAGLGMNSKYSVAFFIISIFAGLLITRQRKIFLNRHLYFAAGLGLLLFLPNLLWQYNRHFPVFVHMEELNRTQLQYIQPTAFIADQFFMNLPAVFVWLAGLYFTIFKINGAFRFIAWAYFFVILILLFFHGKSYYSLGVYPVLFAFGAVQLERFADAHWRIWRYAFIVIPVAIGIAVIPLLLPVAKPANLATWYKKSGIDKLGFLKWEDLRNHELPQDFADMLGWKEMTDKAGKVWMGLSEEEKKHTTIFADNYGQAGALNFYGKEYHFPEVYSDNASFLYWLPDSLSIENLLLITDDHQEMEHDFIHDFSSAELRDSITNPFAREHGSLIILLKGANDRFHKMFEQKIQEDKDRFK